MVAVVAGLFAETPSTTLAATPTARPNVLLIVTDDQTLGTITPQVMPITRQRMIVEGRTYPNFTIADPVCCPSRATIMSGRYSHNTGVHDNHRRSLAAFDERGTVQCYLHRAGYQTGFFGKIFNSWPMYAVHPAPNRYREPLCMDHYAVNAGGGHSGIRILADGRLSIPPGYTDDVVLSKALAYLSSTERDD